MIRALAVLAASAGAASASPTLAAVHTYSGETRACQPLPDGTFLVGTGGGLVTYDASGAKRPDVMTAMDGLPGTRIDGLARVAKGTWIGTELGAHFRPDDDIHGGRTIHTKSSVRDAIEHGGTTYLATDGGVLALGASDDGKHRTLAYTGGNAKLRARVSAFAIANGSLYAGTAGGLFELKKGVLVFVPLQAGANEITSLYGDGATLWIATTNGLYARDGGTLRSYGSGNLRRVTKLDGKIVAAGLGDRMSIVEHDRLVDAKDLPDLQMTQAIGVHAGAACAGGLDALHLRPGKGGWKEVPRPRGIPANDVSALAGDGDTLWVGFFDHGVAKLTKQGWTRIEDENLDHRVNALLVEPRAGKTSRVWVATASGISIIDGARVTRLTKRDGLPARGVLSLARMRDGRILAGTMHGAAIIGDGRPVALGLKQNLEVKNVWAVAEDAEGYLWLGATTGVYRGTPDGGTWMRYSVATRHLRDDWVMALVEVDGAMIAGTYKGGISKLAFTGGTVTATQLAPGWINPGGLRWNGASLEASTMEGLRYSELAGRDWRSSWTFLGRDTTATARAVGNTHWIATRRGLVGMHY